jgi:hypothetical protein
MLSRHSQASKLMAVSHSLRVGLRLIVPSFSWCNNTNWISRKGLLWVCSVVGPSGWSLQLSDERK